MRFLVDECLGQLAARLLEEDGHDVVAVSVDDPGANDGDVLITAWHSDRLVISEDDDIPQKVLRERYPAVGVVFVRTPMFNQQTQAERIREVVTEYRERLLGHLVVVGHASERVRPLNDASDLLDPGQI